MAARKNRGTLDKPWDEKVRAKIQTSMLVNRLADHVKGKVDLAPTQVAAALGLLKKTLPDLTATELSGEVKSRAVVSDQPPTEDEWQRQYGNSLAPPAGTAESLN